MTSTQSQLLEQFKSYATTAPNIESLMKHVVDELHEKMTRYNWVGFYLIDPADPNYLIVGPFAGSFTPNSRIALGQGLCGAAAATGKVVVVDDVTKDPRYLPGFLDGQVRGRRPDLRQQKSRRRTRRRKLFRQHLHRIRAAICRSLRRSGRRANEMR
jgi:GAF domain-containing protein